MSSSSWMTHKQCVWLGPSEAWQVTAAAGRWERTRTNPPRAQAEGNELTETHTRAHTSVPTCGCVCASTAYECVWACACVCVFRQWVNIKSRALSLCNPATPIKVFSSVCVCGCESVNTRAYTQTPTAHTHTHPSSPCNPLTLAETEAVSSISSRFLCVLWFCFPRIKAADRCRWTKAWEKIHPALSWCSADRTSDVWGFLIPFGFVCCCLFLFIHFQKIKLSGSEGDLLFLHVLSIFACRCQVGVRCLVTVMWHHI